MKQVWQSSDGKKVGTLAEITEYENAGKTAAELAFNKLLNTWWYRERNKYSLDTVGIWHIRGEDPNCDFGGSHSQPTLGYFSGTLENAMRKAVTLKGFWQWGSGGDLDLVNVETV